MKKILYLIPFLAFCLLTISCSKTEDVGCLTITGDSTVLNPARLRSYHKIAQQEKMNIHLLIVTEDYPSFEKAMATKATIHFRERQEVDAAITYLVKWNTVLVETNSKYEVALQKGLDKELFRIQMQFNTLPGYQAVDSVMHVVAKAKQETKTYKKNQQSSFFSQVRDDLQWVLAPSDKWFFNILFQPAFELSLLNIRLFHSLRWSIIVLSLLYFALSILMVLKPEVESCCKALRLLALICLVYTLYFCSPTFENYVNGPSIRPILYNSYTATTTGQSRSIGWAIGALVLVVINHLRKSVIAIDKDQKDKNGGTINQDLELNDFAAIAATLASAFILPKILLQAVCLIVGSMLITNIVEDINKHLYHSSKPLDTDQYSTSRYIADLLILVYFSLGFYFWLHSIIADHQPWAWLQQEGTWSKVYFFVCLAVTILVAFGCILSLIDVSESQTYMVRLVVLAKQKSATTEEVGKALWEVVKDMLITLALFAVFVIGMFLTLEYTLAH